MTTPRPAAPLLAADYWLIWSTPHPQTTPEMIGEAVAEHIDWMLDLEASGALLMSGPLTSGGDARPGSGITVLRAGSAEEAREVAAQDPFVTRGLRTFEVYGWRLNEGSISLRVSLGSGTFDWQ